MPETRKSYARFALLAPAVLFIIMIALPALAAEPGATAGIIGLNINNATIPPGGMLQIQVELTEPKPILRGGQRASYASPVLGNPRGISLFSPNGDADGIVVIKNGAATVNLNSPLSSLGTALDYPILTMAIPVLSTAKVGDTADLTLDPSVSSWFDSAGQPYTVEIKNGLLTVGGTIAISDVIPGGGVVNPGTTIAIKGIGFDATSVVDINEGIIASQTFVSANEIDVTLSAALDMTAKRVRVTKSTTNERSEYFSYPRTTLQGRSTHGLVASSYPLFATSTWTLAYFRPTLSGSQFSGLALQNLTGASITARAQLYSSKGKLLSTANLTLPKNTRMVKDYAEIFPGQVAGTGTIVKVTSNTGIQLLGLLGDDAASTVLPVDPTLTP